MCLPPFYSGGHWFVLLMMRMALGVLVALPSVVCVQWAGLCFLGSPGSFSGWSRSCWLQLLTIFKTFHPRSHLNNFTFCSFFLPDKDFSYPSRNLCFFPMCRRRIKLQWFPFSSQLVKLQKIVCPLQASQPFLPFNQWSSAEKGRGSK